MLIFIGMSLLPEDRARKFTYIHVYIHIYIYMYIFVIYIYMENHIFPSMHLIPVQHHRINSSFLSFHRNLAPTIILIHLINSMEYSSPPPLPWPFPPCGSLLPACSDCPFARTPSSLLLGSDAPLPPLGVLRLCAPTLAHCGALSPQLWRPSCSVHSRQGGGAGEGRVREEEGRKDGEEEQGEEKEGKGREKEEQCATFYL